MVRIGYVGKLRLVELGWRSPRCGFSGFSTDRRIVFYQSSSLQMYSCDTSYVKCIMLIYSWPEMFCAWHVAPDMRCKLPAQKMSSGFRQMDPTVMMILWYIYSPATDLQTMTRWSWDYDSVPSASRHGREDLQVKPFDVTMPSYSGRRCQLPLSALCCSDRLRRRFAHRSCQ